MTQVRLEPGALRSRVKHSTTEPLRSLHYVVSPHYVVSDLGLQCLPMSPKKGTRLIWVDGQPLLRQMGINNMK